MKKRIKVFSLLTVFMLLFISVSAYAGSNSVRARFSNDSSALIVKSSYLTVSGNDTLTLTIDNTDAGVEFTANVCKKGLFGDTIIAKYTPEDAEGGSKTINVSSGKYRIKLARSFSSVNATATLSK